MNRIWLDVKNGDCTLSSNGLEFMIRRGLSRAEIIEDLSRKRICHVIEHPGLIWLPNANVFMIAEGAQLTFQNSTLSRAILSVSEGWDSSSDAVQRVEEELVSRAIPVNRRFQWGKVELHGDPISGGVTYTIVYNAHSQPKRPKAKQ